MESYIDTRDLIEERNNLKQRILDDFNERFSTEFDSFDEIVLERLDEEDFNHGNKEEIEDFKGYWEEEYKQIEEIDNIENECEEFEFGCTLIAEETFEDYTKELLEDCGYISRDFPNWIEIDWEATAKKCKRRLFGSGVSRNNLFV